MTVASSHLSFSLIFLAWLYIDTVSYARTAEMRLLRPSDQYYRELTCIRILSCIFFGPSNLHNQMACDYMKLLGFLTEETLFA